MKETSRSPLLFTDFYELTMAQAYWKEAMTGTAVFELFYRQLPPTRNFIVAMGLSDVLEGIENFHIDPSDITFLRETGTFSEEFLDYLRGFHFSGDVYAMEEGTPVFPHEPLVQVVAPILEAQLLETLIINQVHFQSAVASKAARIAQIAQGRTLIDFGSRRAHGTDAALKAARAAYLVGFHGTSNVLAGRNYGLPIFGTMAHSYIQAHGNEYEAFRKFTELYPKTTLLVDTYDTLDGIQNVIRLSQERGANFRVEAVRLDSGDLTELSFKARELLDAAGLKGIRIFASGDLDEQTISQILARHAPIDAFGVGTRMTVAVDAPVLDMVYKLVEYGGKPRTKLSPRKVLYPGRKQVSRSIVNGVYSGDHLGLFHEDFEGAPLLEAVMIQGKRVRPGAENCQAKRMKILARLESLPPPLLGLAATSYEYPVTKSDALIQDLQRLQDSMLDGSRDL